MALEQPPAPTKDDETAVVNGEALAEEPAPAPFTITVTVKVRGEGKCNIFFRR